MQKIIRGILDKNLDTIGGLSDFLGLLISSDNALFAEGRQRERSAQVIPRRSRFGSLLLVNHRPSSLCHSATNEP